MFNICKFVNPGKVRLLTDVYGQTYTVRLLTEVYGQTYTVRLLTEVYGQTCTVRLLTEVYGQTYTVYYPTGSKLEVTKIKLTSNFKI